MIPQTAYDTVHHLLGEPIELYKNVEKYMANATPDPNPLDVQVGGDHYKKLKIQPIEYIMENDIPYAEGNIIKYITRWRNKGGIKDLEKIKHYVDILIQAEKAKDY